MKLYQNEKIMKSLENAGMKIDIKPRLELKKSDEKAELYLYGGFCSFNRGHGRKDHQRKIQYHADDP